MRHLIFEQAERYEIAVLTKAAAFSEMAMRNHYIEPLQKLGVATNRMIGFTLEYNEAGKVPVAFIKDYLDKLLVALNSLGVKYLFCTDAAYFKTLTKMSKAEPHYGYVLPCKIQGFEHMQVVLGLNYQQLVYNPELYQKLDMSLQTLADAVQGSYQPLGHNIIHSAQYPSIYDEIAAALDSLHQYPELSADIEAFGLAFNQAGIASIGFAWDQHNGVSFLVDYKPIAGATSAPFGERWDNQPVKQLLLNFLTSYKGKLTWHNASYDLRSIIYALWMKDPLDQKGLLLGLDILTRSFDDTKVIAYLATNSTAGNVLGLKALAHEFAGNWAVEEINNVLAIEPAKLLQYNLVDCLSTNYVKAKYYPVMVADRQEELYHTLMLPSLKVIIQMELTGMPMERSRVQEAKAELERLEASYLKVIMGHPLIAPLEAKMTHEAWEKDFEDRRGKAKNPDKIFPKDRTFFPKSVFNPNSGPQLQRLLYQEMGLPVIDLTDTKQPATGGDTLEKLVNHASKPEDKAFLQAMVEYTGVTKILSAFIPAFERALDKGDGKIWLHGGYNLGGTVSGRLSSSKPNMQQIPSGSTFGKLIKSCFAAPKGWIFAGADFNSLEDYISALTTKDPNKLNVYIKGFDGHCLRAAYYFQEDLLARGIRIALDDPASVNSIKKLAPDLRQDSKAPTFLLTYGGTYHGMMSNLGWPEDKAKVIEANYHDLYKVSDEYVAKRLEQAAKDGYVEVAFGLRVRTPLLKQVIWKGSKMPYEAAAEGRTAGNALGQSYGLLNNRAAVEFMQKVWASPYRYDILPVALIHDAIYLLIRDRIDVVTWANRELIKSMQWQELPEIQHDTVKLGAALDLFYPDWAHPITLPNDATPAQIREVCEKALGELESHKEAA